MEAATATLGFAHATSLAYRGRQRFLPNTVKSIIVSLDRQQFVVYGISLIPEYTKLSGTFSAGPSQTG